MHTYICMCVSSIHYDRQHLLSEFFPLPHLVNTDLTLVC